MARVFEGGRQTDKELQSTMRRLELRAFMTLRLISSIKMKRDKNMISVEESLEQLKRSVVGGVAAGDVEFLAPDRAVASADAPAI